MKRFRFAPSPTGHLHIGGARTALYNYLMARKTKGTFILRIEDTDRARSTREYIDSILKAMEWLRLECDEGPFFQTERTALYYEHLQRLLSEGKAYRCFCSPEEIEAKRQKAQAEGKKPRYDGTCRALDPILSAEDKRPFCIRFKSTLEGTTVVEDLIKGRVVFNNNELDDMIIARSDGTPTYNFVVVVDDVTMQMTHVIRGDDHLNNTPRQIQLYQAFDYPIPKFAHVPMILGADKSRLSKRHGATSVLAYQESGYLPEALLNYLVRLGWSHGDEEVFSMEKMIEVFDIADVGSSAAVFDPAKLEWLNGVWIRASTPQRLLKATMPFFAKKGIMIQDESYAERAIATCQEKVKNLIELADLASFYFVDHVAIEPKIIEKVLHAEGISLLKKALIMLMDVEPFTKEKLEAALKNFAEKSGIKLGEIAQPLRAALTGSAVSPGIFDVLSVLGKKRVQQRVQSAISLGAIG